MCVHVCACMSVCVCRYRAKHLEGFRPTINRASLRGRRVGCGGDRKRRLVGFILYTLVLFYIFIIKYSYITCLTIEKKLRKFMGFNVERPGFESQLSIA